MKTLNIVLYVLAAVCVVITIIDAVTNHQFNTLYLCCTAAALCGSAAAATHKKKD